MIEHLLPLSKKKMDILMYIYENQPAHLRKIATDLKMHPYLVKRYIDLLKTRNILDQQKAGKTILLTINLLHDNIEQLIYVIESYKQKSENKTLKTIIKALQQQFSRNNKICSCIVFGSYARGAASKESDVDILFIVTSKKIETELIKKLSQLGVLINLKLSPIMMTENEFKVALETKEPTTVTILKNSQRIIIFGLEYFIRTVVITV